MGQAVFPRLGQSQPLADGALFTGSGFSPLFDPNIFSRYFVGRFAPDADRLAVERRIAAIPQLSDQSGPTLPVEVVRLRQITWFPLSVALLLSGLALLSVGCSLIVGVRRRGRELAVLRTLGFTGRQVRATVGWEATVFATVGLIVGIPSGLVAGRLVWRLVADSLGVSTTPTIPGLALAVLSFGALALLNVIAWLPGRSAARTRPADALRVE